MSHGGLISAAYSRFKYSLASGGGICRGQCRYRFDLYDRVNLIPWVNLTDFFTQHLQ